MAMLPTAETLAVLSQNGGTRKTTTVLTLADALRRAGLTCWSSNSIRRAICPTTSTCPADAAPTIADVLRVARSARAGPVAERARIGWVKGARAGPSVFIHPFGE